MTGTLGPLHGSACLRGLSVLARHRRVVLPALVLCSNMGAGSMLLGRTVKREQSMEKSGHSLCGAQVPSCLSVVVVNSLVLAVWQWERKLNAFFLSF